MAGRDCLTRRAVWRTACEVAGPELPSNPGGRRDAPGSYQDSLPWQELAQLRLVGFQPVLASNSLSPLLCVTELTEFAL